MKTKATIKNSMKKLSNTIPKAKRLKVNREDKITFGKYKGKTFGEIAKIDLDYIDWLDENVKTIKIDRDFVTAVRMDIEERDSELYDILAEHRFDIY
jgi:hypothetical protein